MPPRTHVDASASATPIISLVDGQAPPNSLEQDIDAMLCKSQLGNFSGEGKYIGKVLEDWIKRMDDYLDLAQSSDANKAIIALKKTTKSWWRDHC